MKKQILSILLVAVILLTMLPVYTISSFALTSGDFEYEILEDGTAEITDYTGDATELKIPSEINGYTVKAIGNYAFNHNFTSLTNVVIPDGVISIGEEAFYNCTLLTSIKIPDSVAFIGEKAFAWCKSLTSINIPNGVDAIEPRTFEYCKSLTSITIPNSVTDIGYNAFAECEMLMDIVIPDSVTSIGADAFYNTGYYNAESNWENSVFYINDILIDAKEEISGLYEIKEGTKIINDSAFYHCTSLTSVKIPNSVSSIGDGAFHSCISLTSIIIPEGVTSINFSTFYQCTSLKSVTIPDSVTCIYYSAFAECDMLNDVYYSGNVEQWKEIYIGEGNDSLFNATIHYNYGKQFTGIKDNHFYKDDVMQKAYQLVEFDGDFYFIGDRHEIVKNKTVYLNETRINGLTYADGTPIQVGYYDFDENGKMIMREGIVGNNIYKNNVQLKAYQLVEVNGDFYFIGDRHEIVKNSKIYLNEARINGLTYDDGTPIAVGYYNVDENGKMIIRDGIVGNNIYKNNVQLKAYQLVEVDGNFYFIGDRHEIVKNSKIYLNEARINGLTYEDGTPIAVGYYNVDADGKLIVE